MADHNRVRILLVTFPGQGHINPSLQFAKRLVGMGANVTFATAYSALNRMTKTTTPSSTTPQGLSFTGFSDGYDGGWTMTDIEDYMAEIKRRGSEAVAELITSNAKKGEPFIHVVYTTLIPWVGEVTHALHVPSTFLWIQPAAILDIYYYYFNGFDDAFRNSKTIELPGLPPLNTSRDLPSFLCASNSYNFALPLLKTHLDLVETETNPKVLVNTFDGLELESLRAVEKLNMIAVGPLIPSAFLDGNDPSDASFGGDLFQKPKENYIEWLDSKPKGSVIYVAFGSYSILPKQQMEEIARGLLQCGRPFLWVIRVTTGNEEKKEEEEDELSCKVELEKQGMIVPWCSQVEILSHKSLGCFVSHCGWNSSLESLVSGVPVVAFPQWSDQVTNAKLIEDVWKTGVRLSPNEERIVESDEIKRGIETVMGTSTGEEMRRNANKWKELAKEAAKEGGSSDLNLKSFLDEMVRAV